MAANPNPNPMASVAQVIACTAIEAMRNRQSTTGGNVTPLSPTAFVTPSSSSCGTSLTPGSTMYAMATTTK